MVALVATLLQSLFSFYNTVFQPLLAAGPHIALGAFSVALAGIFSLIYARMLDQERADEIKEKLSDTQDRMKEARKNGEDEKASEHMQETMELNQKLMKLNLKPMAGTMIFVALIFPWLGNTFAPLVDLQEESPGVYEGQFAYGGASVPVQVDNSSGTNITVDEETVEEGGSANAFGVRWQVVEFRNDTGGFFSEAKGPSLKMNAAFVDLPVSLPLVGGELNWLGFYIVIAMPLTFGFRRLLGVS